jgi:hypothetical protein
MRKIAIAARAAAMLASPAHACTSAQRAWLQNQIAETERLIDLNESAPPSSRSNQYPGMRAQLRGLYHAMQECNDSIWNEQDPPGSPGDSDSSPGY